MSDNNNFKDIFDIDQYLKKNPNAFDNGLKPHFIASSIQPKIGWLHLDESIKNLKCQICHHQAVWVAELPTKTKIYSCNNCQFKF